MVPTSMVFMSKSYFDKGKFVKKLSVVTVLLNPEKGSTSFNTTYVESGIDAGLV
jgi:hypothetical protein